MLRVVRAPDGHVAIDESGRAPGRGAYVCRDGACLQRAVARGALGRALATRLPADVQSALGAVVATEPVIDQNMLNTQGGARGQE